MATRDNATGCLAVIKYYFEKNIPRGIVIFGMEISAFFAQFLRENTKICLQMANFELELRKNGQIETWVFGNSSHMS